MKLNYKYFKLTMAIFFVMLICPQCDLNRAPETVLPEELFWKKELDFMSAVNRLYALLEHPFLDFRGDDMYRGRTPDLISSGTRIVPAKDRKWTTPYSSIFVANRIIQNAPKEDEAIGAINRYVAEARFFRAYNYFLLITKFGDVPLLKRSAANSKDEILFSPRVSRDSIARFLYADLDTATKYLPFPEDLTDNEYGRITRTAAWALKARIALYEGCRAKYHYSGNSAFHFKASCDASNLVINSQKHELYKAGLNPYKDLFEYKGTGAANKENIFVKLYGYKNNLLVSHNVPYDYWVNCGPTRNFLNLYLTKNGLPYDDEPEGEITYNDYFKERDPRLTESVIQRGMKGYNDEVFRPYNLSKTAFTFRKLVPKEYDQPSVLDIMIIRYAEVLLTYAEAKYELDGSITDADIDRTINKLRDRVGFVHLSNQHVTDNNLNMLEEIRRERSVELAFEGFRYDDIIRWKTAENLLPIVVLGAKFIEGEWGSASLGGLAERLTEDKLLIVESAEMRFFDPERDYLYPIPYNDIAQSKGTLSQNPKW